MNRYPVWKYAILVIVLLVGVLYTLPNFFGEAPAVQVSSAKATVKVDTAVQQRVEEALKAAGVTPDFGELEGNSVRARFDAPDTQLKAKDAIQKALVPDASDPSFIVALNLVSRSPVWLKSLHANPMYLGLDLRGGVHFMLQVDMQAALTKKAESYAGDIRTALRDKSIRHGGISREGQNIDIKVRDEATMTAARNLIADQFPDLQVTSTPEGTEFKLRVAIKPEATAKAKDILGRTATLEVRLVDEGTEARAAETGRGPVPFGSERYLERSGQPVIVKKQVILTGENLTDAQPGFDGQTQEPTVNLTLDAKGARIFKDITRENVCKRMAIVLFEKGKGEVVTAPVIRTEIGGGRVQISGRMTTAEANDTALLLRAGSLAAPMEIIEEFTIGPSLGADNIERGINSVVWGLIAIAIFMCAYYMLFGVFSSIALGVNVLLLVAVLSMLQATLTLPGIA